MPDVSFAGLAIVCAVGFAVPLALGLVPALRLPPVVLEIVAGIGIGPSVLGWVKPDLPIQILSLFLLALLLIRGLPAALYRPVVGTRRTAPAALLQATSLPFIVAASQIGLELHLITKATSAALIAAGLISVLIFPLAEVTILRRAAVLGAGTIALLATMILRLRGLEVTTFGRTPKPYLNSDLIEALGARYISTAEMPLREAAPTYGPFDIIYEATGFSPLVFEAMEVLAKNGVLVLASVTGGSRTVEVPADKINLDFVLGNKVMVGTVNGNREYFEATVRDLAMAEAQYPGWVGRLLTHPIDGLDNYRQMIDTLTHARDAIKVYLEIAPGAARIGEATTAVATSAE